MAINSLLVAGCGGAAFREDDRITIQQPRDGSTIQLPVDLRWEASEVMTTDPGRPEPAKVYYAVFVDRLPLGPGESLLALIERECAEAGDGCATRAYFEQRNVYLTGDNHLVIPAVEPITEHRRDAQIHEVTVVLMDHEHRRLGESAWRTTFRVKGL